MNKASSNSDQQLDALFTRARQGRPDTSRAEYGFETRLLARLRERPQPGGAFVWARMTWRLAPFFAVCVVALALWQARASSEANDAAAIAGLNNPVAGDLWGN